MSLSATYLANAKRCELCAVFEHLRWHLKQLDSYRYEGAQCLATHTPGLLEQAHAIGGAVAREFGLRGCFSLDFIYSHAGALYLVDINPRPPATLDLLADRGQIFAAHLAAGGCGELLYSRPRARAASAQIVLYAEQPWRVASDMRWPVWTADRPAAGTFIARDAPL